MNGATAKDRRELVERAYQRLTKIRDPNLTRIGWSVVVDLVLDDLGRAIAIDEKASRPGKRTDGVAP